ncbi:Spy/CpxP family protein refolding chaperone [Sulfurihydrogenibium subterraneum]|uniref:Spy/CpxP family protein refolding chaperone n=1 Tax=Sulfurihydrogenibium subterraneum TaxID=171121 RepID=UPI000685F8A3|nr:hypothetical protein [Sulfurihydrogenibium subterraneum]
MRFVLVMVLIFFLNAFSQPKDDYSWMDKYFLIEPFNIYNIVMMQKTDLELTQKQIDAIKSEYDKYFPIMLGKSRILKDKEEELKKLVYGNSDPEKVKNLIVEIAKLKSEMTVLDINLFKAVQSILNKKQNEKLIKYLTSGSL